MGLWPHFLLGQSSFFKVELPILLTRKTGQDLYLSASPLATNSGTSFIWYWNGSTNLPSASVSLNAALFKPILAPADAGEYKLVVFNNGSPVATNLCHVSVDDNAPDSSGSDVFSSDSGRWSGIYGFGGTNGICSGDSFWKIAEGRLNFRLIDQGATNDTGASYLWDHRLPGDRNWEARVSASIGSNVSPPDFIELRLGCSIPMDRHDPFASRCGLGITFGALATTSATNRLVQGHVELISQDSPIHTNQIFLTNPQNIELRLLYTNYLLKASYRVPPGGQWILVATNPVADVPLTNGFQIELIGYSTQSVQLTNGQLFFDNFSAQVELPPFFDNFDPTTEASDGLTYLMKYAYGAANPTSPISQSLRPVTTLTTNGSGQPVLALTYFTRTNDTNLTTQPMWQTNLSSPAGSWSSNVTVTVLGTTNTNGLVLERRQATVPVDSNSRKFLRLKANLKQ